MKELFKILEELPDGIELKISHFDKNIMLIPLLNGNVVDEVPCLVEITPEGELVHQDVNMEETVTALEAITRVVKRGR